MTVYACVQCGGTVAASARRCPHCGEKRPAPTTENIVKAAIGLAIVLIFLVALIAH